MDELDGYQFLPDDHYQYAGIFTIEDWSTES